MTQLLVMYIDIRNRLPGHSIFFKCTSTSLFTAGTFFLLKFEQFHEYLIQHSLKSGGTIF